MITKRDIGEKTYILSNNIGDIAFGNQSGISYLKNCTEEKEIKKYAKKNNLKVFAFFPNAFSVIACSAYLMESLDKFIQEKR